MRRKIRLVKESVSSYLKEGTKGWEETGLGENLIEMLMDELQDLGLTWEEADFAISQVDDWQMDMWMYEVKYDDKSVSEIADIIKKDIFMYEFAKRRSRPRKKPSIDSPDAWGDGDDEFDVEIEDPEHIEDDEIDADEELDLKFYEKLKKILRNELTSPEFNRGYISFKIRRENKRYKGIPMAELKDGFLFKINGKLKKVKLTDMIIL